MATNRWRGDAKNVAQVNTITPANVNIGNTFTVTINGKDITYTAAAATVADVTAGLTALLNASTVPEFEEITWADATTHITGTADTAGKPFTQTSSASGGTATLVTATATANESNNDLNNADNWSNGAVPGNGDDVFFSDTDVSCLYNLGALSAVTLTSLTIDQSFTGDIGLPRTTDSGYVEYRAQELAIGATTITIGKGEGDGSGRLRLNMGSVQAALSVFNTGAATDTDGHALEWRGTHASNVVNVLKGSVSVAKNAGETAVIATLRIGYRDDPASDVTLYLGTGVTLTTVNMAGGQVTIQSAATTINQTGGTLWVLGSGAITTINVDAGTAYLASSGTITTLNVGSDAVVSFNRDLTPRTVTTTNVYAGSTLRDTFRAITFTNGIDLERCGLADVTLDLGEHFKITPATAT